MRGEVSTGRLGEAEGRHTARTIQEREEREGGESRQAQQAAPGCDQRACDEGASASCWDASQYDDESQVPCYWCWACKEDIWCDPSRILCWKCSFPCLGLCADHRVGVVSREPEQRGSRTVLARVRLGRPPRCSFWDVLCVPFVPLGLVGCSPCCEYTGLTSFLCWSSNPPAEEPTMQLAYYPYVYVTVEQEHDSDDKHVRVTHPVCCNCSSSVVDAQGIELRAHEFVRESSRKVTRRGGDATIHRETSWVYKLIARHGDATIGLSTWFDTPVERLSEAQQVAVVLHAALLGLPMDEGAPAQQSMTSSGAVLSTI